MKANYVYYVKYQMHGEDGTKGIEVLAPNKTQAYFEAMYNKIPKKENRTPVIAWVSSVTYNNGNYKKFKGVGK